MGAPAAVRETMPHGPGWCMVNYSRRAARWAAPTMAPSGQFFTSRGYPEAMSLL